MKMFRVVVNGNEYKVGIEELNEEGEAVAAPTRPTVRPAAAAAPAVTPAAKPSPAPVAAPGGAVLAPMPGTILEVKVSEGDTVSKGQTLLILEAMKMQNEIMAPADGTVAAVKVSKGGSVNAGEVLIQLS
jgi:glutaconyl-CoA/methylmalonyl-CoA decarboxylase subunit gamma